MRVQNKVSVFVGYFPSKTHLEEYIQEHFTEEGDIFSDLMKDIDTDFIDNQFMETLFVGKSLTISDLNDFSYSENFINKLAYDMSNFNSLILLYNYEQEATFLSGKIKLIGIFDYR